MNQFLKQLAPFVIAGMIIVALAFGIMLLAYIFLIGLILGCIIFLIRIIRDKFFSPRKPVKPKPGRIIDSNDWKKL